MLTFENITRKYALDEETTITPVDSVSLRIEPGEFIIITGRSGTGKTTLLNLAAGLVRPTSGRVLVGDTDLNTMNDKQLSTLRSERMGFVFQFPSLLAALTVKENVMLPGIFASDKKKKDNGERAEIILGQIGLSGKLNCYPKQLSAGEQKRVVIARALINEPELILADEPTSGLDEQTEREIMDLLRGINDSGVTIVMVTHSMELVQFADRAFHMEKGELTEMAKSSVSGSV